MEPEIYEVDGHIVTKVGDLLFCSCGDQTYCEHKAEVKRRLEDEHRRLLEDQQRENATLNGDRPFNLLK